jgi:tRNA threonylcarbamoyladenosine biosynthesis protein TsaE
LIFKDIQESDLGKVCESIFDLGKDHLIWTFNGNLGAGKTTLIKALSEKMGIQEAIHSPTFSYVNTYDDVVHHFDCYRLKHITEALDFGIEDYLDSGIKCWIEWPEIIETLLPRPYLEIKIEHTQNNARDISLKIII